MWKWMLFNSALFYIVSYLGTKNHVSALCLAVIFGIVHYFAGKMLRENMTSSGDVLPDSSRIPPCPVGMERASNGLDCKSKGDLYGL